MGVQPIFDEVGRATWTIVKVQKEVNSQQEDLGDYVESASIVARRSEKTCATMWSLSP